MSVLVEQICIAIQRSPWPLEEIGRRARVHPTTMYMWITGTTRDPRILTLERVADALGYDIKLARGGAALVLRANGLPPKPKATLWQAWMRQGD